MSAWGQDLRLALRGVGRAKAFYTTAVVTLAVGMAGATVMFTLIRGILLRPLPVPEEDRLVVSWRIPPTGLASHIPYRATDIEALARESRVFERVSGVGYHGAYEERWDDGGRTVAADTAVVMGGFFAVTGVSPLFGRVLTGDDDRSGAERTVVLSFAAWQRLFGGSPDVVGRRLMARSRPYTIVGVMPADFEFPRGVEIWTTRHARVDGEPVEGFSAGILRDVELVGRLRLGVTLEQARSELTTVIGRLDVEQSTPSFVNFPSVVRPFKTLVVGDIDRALVVLFAAVGLILLIAAANVANLLLMRGETRRSELVVRAALGASRGRLVGELIAEGLVVAVAAAAVGLILSEWSLQTVTALVPDGLPRQAAIRTDLTVVAFTALLAFVAAALSGAVPALAASHIDLVAQLRAGGRGATGVASARGRRLLVAAQVALAVTVVAAAGLLGRSLQRLQSADMGLAAERLVMVELDVPRENFTAPERHRRFLDDVSARIGGVSGIEAVTPLNVQPFAGATGWELPRFTAEGQSEDQVAANPSLNFEAAYLRYFSTLGIPIVRGRDFTAADRDGAPRVAIVSEAVAATWPGQDPVGKRVKFGGIASKNEWMTVVGVAATTRYRELAVPRPTLYIPNEQFGISATRLAIRTTATPGFVAGVVDEAVRTADRDVRVVRVASYSDYLRQPIAWPRFNALVLTVFAGAALLLSAVGLYGVMAASVRQRYAEIGVRLALGATGGDVRRLVLGEGLRLAVGGALAGLAMAWATTRVLEGMLFETEPLDPWTLTAAALLLVAAAVLATWLPARRAMRVDPIAVLRAE